MSRLSLSAKATKDYLRSVYTDILRDIETKVNGLAEGRIFATHNATIAAPTTGPHQEGDVVRNTDMTTTGDWVLYGWICTVAGEPGTWRELWAPLAIVTGGGGGGGTLPYDVAGTYNGGPPPNTVLLRFPFPRAVVFPAGLTDSQGVCVIAATAQTDFDLRKNGVSFGTMRFAAAATTATFISASGASFAIGDILTVVSPSSPDATLGSVGFSLTGTR